ncbi:MAG TPA: flagellar hook-basal body complex protein [Amaricoccus sp.]|jgi:flagellar basal-body rod protein FlgF|nr:flagellar hook-basal body complex protein [Amaricoccus sp.]
MDLAGYVALTRVSGLAKELQSVANNIANVSTTGYRREGVVFAEMVQALSAEGGSVAMTEARGRYTDELQGTLVETGGTLDLAVEGDGYFTVMTAQGQRLTRAGAFTRNGDGTVVNMDGHPLLDEGGGEIVIPFEAKAISVSADGTLSVDGQPAAKLGLVRVADQTRLFREAGVLFRADTDVEYVEDGRIVQGFLEQSNVNPVGELARMIEVQRAYESGQKLLDQEDERIRRVITTLGQQA